MSGSRRRCEPSTVVTCRTVTFVVADDGIGMEPAFCEHMFEPFAMEGRSASAGTGLGMAIVKNIVSLMGGDTLSSGNAGGEGNDVHGDVLNLQGGARTPSACLLESGARAEASDAQRGEVDAAKKAATEILPTACGRRPR